MVAPNGVEFMRYGAGEMVGESDSLLGQSRDCKAIAAEDCTLYILRTDQCLPLFREHRTVYESLQKQAYKKRRLHARRMKNLTLPFTEMMDKLSVAMRRKIHTKYGINTDKASQLNKSSFAESAISPSEEDSEVKILKGYVEKHLVNPASAEMPISPSQFSDSQQHLKCEAALKSVLEADESGLIENISATKVLENLAADMKLLSENIEVMGQLAGKIVAKA